MVLALFAALFIDKVPLPTALKQRRMISAIMDFIALTRAGLTSRAGLAAVGLSLVIHVMTILAVASIAAGLGLNNLLIPIALVVPTALIAAAIPISLNGWGVREGVMVAGFALFGVAQADAFLISVLLGFSVVISALPGGFTWLTLR
ncbi:MAG: hypothetical protein EXR10_12185 [Alphaproteobacteria bacterium]|nr:hypothetical protein [Alphaproteobacteria bacterium]